MRHWRHHGVVYLLLLTGGLLLTLAWAQEAGPVASLPESATNDPTAVLPTAVDQSVCQTATVDIAVQNVTDLYGYQFELTYDDSLVDATAAFVQGFFDANGSGLTLPGWDAACAAGVCRFARTEFNPDGPVSGSGVIARVTLTADLPATPGAFNVVVQNVGLTDRDSFAIAATGGSLPMTVCGEETGVCPVDPEAGTVGNQRTTILGTGMGSPDRSRTMARITVPDPTHVIDLYGQMAAKSSNGIRYARFMYGDGQYVQVQPATDTGQQYAISWWGADLDQTILRKSRSSRPAGSISATASATTCRAPSCSIRPTPPTAATPTPGAPIPRPATSWPIRPPSARWLSTAWRSRRTQAVTDIVVQVAVTDVDRDARVINLTVSAGSVSETRTLVGPTTRMSELLNLETFTLTNVPAGTDEIVITLESPAANGDSAALLGAAAHYACEP